MTECRAGYGNALIYNTDANLDKIGEKMGNKTFKAGVSNWTATFSDGMKVVFDALMDETVYFSASNKVKISLKSATFSSEFISYFRNAESLVDLQQSFELRNPMGEIVENLEYSYNGLKIKNIKTISKSDEVAEVNIVFST